MNELISSALATVAKALPVGVASRTALLGVVLLAVAGGFHEHSNTVSDNEIKAGLELLRQDIQDVKELQTERKEEINKRLDRLEGKVDQLLLNEKKRGS